MRVRDYYQVRRNIRNKPFCLYAVSGTVCNMRICYCCTQNLDNVLETYAWKK